MNIINTHVQLIVSVQCIMMITILRFRFTTDGRDSDDEIDFYDSQEALIFNNITYANRKLKTKNGTNI